MAITVNTFNIQVLPVAGKAWQVSLQSADVSGCEAIKAAETGHTHYLTKLTIRTDAAMDVSVGSGGDDGTEVTTTHIGPVPLSAEDGIFEWEAPPKKGLKCTSGLSIAIDATAGGTTWIEAHGRTVKE